MRTFLKRFFVLLVAILWLSPAEAARHSISGQVLDRNGQPVERAIVTLEPGNVSLITDMEGRFLIDYARDAEGMRTKLLRKVDYKLEIFKPGFHLEQRKFYYKKGAILVDAITLNEDTLVVPDDGQNVDQAMIPEATQTSGANYEGQ